MRPLFLLTTIITVAMLSLCSPIHASGKKNMAPLPTIQANDLWQDFDLILKAIATPLNYQARDGKFFHTAIDYRKLVKSNELSAALQRQLAKLEVTQPPSSQQALKTFWINAYNFFTLVDVKNNMPLESMKDLGWKGKHHRVGGKTYSLDQIEHKILRPMNDPRVHFAVNCASVGCPSLGTKAFTEKRLNAELDTMTRNALRNPLHLRSEKAIFGSDNLATTKLFRWFGDDFEAAPYKTTLAFIKAFAPKRYKSFDDYSGSISYDWSLNTATNIKKRMAEIAKEHKDVKLKILK